MIKIFLKLIAPFFRSTEKRKAWLFLFLLLLLSASVITIQVWMSYSNRDLMTAITDRNNERYIATLLIYLLTIASAIPIGVIYRYCEERFALLWREWMTNHLIKKYFFKRAYYNLRGEEQLDNPDQRIAEDVRNFTATTLSFGLIILNSFVTLISFIGVLYSISGVLVLVLIGYAVIGTGLTILIGKRLIGIHYLQYQKEANLRYGLVRVRDNAESIAFFRGEPRERLDLMHKLSDLIKNTFNLINWNRNLAFFTSGYNYVALVVPLIVIVPKFINREIEFGVVTQAVGAFAQVLAAMSLIITQFERLSAYTAGVKRLAGLWEALNSDDTSEDDDPEISVEEGKSLVLTGLTVRPPKSERVLVKELTFTLPKAQGLMIMGESGSGKSSILRTIAGLWNSGEGAIKRPQLKKMMFLPQKPYLMTASLKANILYPHRSDTEIAPGLLEEAISAVHLDDVLKRAEHGLETELDWTNILSLGEQQRLSFARLVISKPELIFLDEATSALDEENETILYSFLKSMKCPFVSVGHRSTIKKFHDYLLLLDGVGGWKIEKI